MCSFRETLNFAHCTIVHSFVSGVISSFKTVYCCHQVQGVVSIALMLLQEEITTKLSSDSDLSSSWSAIVSGFTISERLNICRPKGEPSKFHCIVFRELTKLYHRVRLRTWLPFKVMYWYHLLENHQNNAQLVCWFVILWRKKIAH